MNVTQFLEVSVTSSEFINGSPIPAENTCDGADQSPQLSWTSMPDTTQSLAIVFDEAESGTTNWVVFNIAPTHDSVAEGASIGIAGMNDFKRAGYTGPCPTPGSLRHYRIIVYGLDTMLPSSAGEDRRTFDRVTGGHVLALGQLLCTYSR